MSLLMSTNTNRFLSPRALSTASIVLLLIGGLAAFLWKLGIVSALQFVGFGDPAAYSEMAESLLQGRGFEVDYISMYFRKFSPDISHPEDTWPPLYPVLIAPFFAVMGKSAVAAKLPSLLLSCFVFPLIVYLLARRIARSEAVALVSGISILLFGPVFSWSLYAGADIAFGLLVVLALYFTVKGFEDSRWFIPMGAALALSYYAKALGIVAAGGVIAYYVLRRLLYRPRFPLNRDDLRFGLGVALLLAMLLPWFVRNTIHFDDPLFSNHKHVAGYVGWEPWEEKTYAVYWDEEPPSAWDKFQQPVRLALRTLEHVYNHFRILFVRMNPLLSRKDEDTSVVSRQANIPPFSIRDISTYAYGFPALLGVALFIGGALLRRQGIYRLARPEYGLFLVVGSVLVLSVSMLWVPDHRLNTPIIPLVMIMGWTTLYSLLARIPRLPSHAVTIALLALSALWAGFEIKDLRHAQNQEAFPWREQAQSVMALGDWIESNAPDSIVMAKDPMCIHFYSDAKAVRLPTGPLSRVLDVARYHRLTHMIPDRDDPDYAFWFRRGHPGLRPVQRIQDQILFEIDYTNIPDWIDSK
jgi:4-amino-4-deoxy-L-arabinose transferase-like glycosyltransferase